MPSTLKRYQRTRHLHYVTFNCYGHAPNLDTPAARDLFEQTLERVRRWCGFYLNAYVVMSDHVHLLISEPERSTLAVVVQMLKQIVSRKLSSTGAFWQRRYYGQIPRLRSGFRQRARTPAKRLNFNVWSEKELYEKMQYIHENPVRRAVWSRRRKIGSGAVFAICQPGKTGWWRLNRNGRPGSGSGWGCFSKSKCRESRCPPFAKTKPGERVGHPPVDA